MELSVGRNRGHGQAPGFSGQRMIEMRSLNSCRLVDTTWAELERDAEAGSGETSPVRVYTRLVPKV